MRLPGPDAAARRLPVSPRASFVTAGKIMVNGGGTPRVPY
jgi:hypothetical protein